VVAVLKEETNQEEEYIRKEEKNQEEEQLGKGEQIQEEEQIEGEKIREEKNNKI